MHAEKGAWVGHAPGQPFYGERGRVRCNDVGLGGRNGSQHIALYRPILRHCLYHQVDAVTGTCNVAPMVNVIDRVKKIGWREVGPHFPGYLLPDAQYAFSRPVIGTIDDTEAAAM